MTTPTILTQTAGGAAPAINEDAYTISGSNLVFAVTGSYGQCYNDNPASEGSYYFELTNNSPNSGIGANITICSPSTISHTTDIGGSNFDGAIGVGQLGNLCNNGSVGGAIIPRWDIPGTVLCIAVSLPNLVWFRVGNGSWNGNASADPATGVGGVSLTALTAPLCVAIDAGTNFDATVNFGQNPFVYSPPALFNNWPGAESITLTSATITAGSPMALVGMTNNAIAEALDYSTDAGNTWTACTAYTSAADWTASGPTYAAGSSGNIIVRDHANPTVVSAPVFFRLPYVPPTYATVIFEDAFTSTDEMVANGWNLSPLTFTNYEGTTSVTWGADGVLLIGDLIGGFMVAGFCIQTVTTPVTDWTAVFELALLSHWNGENQNLVFGLSSATDKDNIDAFQILLSFDKDTSNNLAINTCGVYTPNGTYEFTYDDTCTLIVSSTKNATTGLATTTVMHNGTAVVAEGPTTPPMGMLGEFIWNTQSGYSTAFPNIAQISNFVIYSTTPPPETLVITGASCLTGSPVALEGTNTAPIAPALDYSLDGSATWEPVSGYVSGMTWSGLGPVPATGTHTIQVRDDTDHAILSNTFTFTVGVGIYIWDGVKINP